MKYESPKKHGYTRVKMPIKVWNSWFAENGLQYTWLLKPRFWKKGDVYYIELVSTKRARIVTTLLSPVVFLLAGWRALVHEAGDVWFELQRRDYYATAIRDGETWNEYEDVFDLIQDIEDGIVGVKPDA